jgi:hypothetical protein
VNLQSSFDAGAGVEVVAQSVADEVEAVCGREQNGSPQPKSRVKRGISESSFDAGTRVEVVAQGVTNEVEAQHGQHHGERGKEH